MTTQEARRIVQESSRGSDQHTPDERAMARGKLLAQAEDEYEKWKKEQGRGKDG